MKHNFDKNGYCISCSERQAMHAFIKQAGLDSVKQLTERTEQSPQTLKNWYLHKQKLFNVVVAGALANK